MRFYSASWSQEADFGAQKRRGVTKNCKELKKTSKNKIKRGTAVSGCQNGTVPEQGEIHLPYSLFANFIENDFSKKH